MNVFFDIASWVYDIDTFGNILSKELREVPTDINKFDSKSVVKNIMEEYKNIIT